MGRELSFSDGWTSGWVDASRQKNSKMVEYTTGGDYETSLEESLGGRSWQHEKHGGPANPAAARAAKRKLKKL